jgi:hypothetical protein
MAERIWLRNEWPNLLAWAVALAAATGAWRAVLWLLENEPISGYAALVAAGVTLGCLLRTWHLLQARMRHA